MILQKENNAARWVGRKIKFPGKSGLAGQERRDSSKLHQRVDVLTKRNSQSILNGPKRKKKQEIGPCLPKGGKGGRYRKRFSFSELRTTVRCSVAASWDGGGLFSNKRDVPGRKNENTSTQKESMCTL